MAARLRCAAGERADLAGCTYPQSRVATSADSMPSPRKRHALGLFAGLPRHYDRMGAVLSFGQDPRWRRALVDRVAPQPGQRVLDVATGTGLVASELIRRGGSDADLKKLAGENLLRAFRQAEQVSARLRKERPASTATIEQLDGGTR